MAKTTHASVQTMQIASLLSELELKCDDAMRCQEIIARAASVDPKEKVSLEVVNFVKAYVPDIELYSAEEGFLDTAGDLLKRAFEAILKAIAWIIENSAISSSTSSTASSDPARKYWMSSGG